MRKIAKALLDLLLIIVLYFQSYLLLTLEINGYWDIPVWIVKSFAHHHNRSEMNLEIERFRLYPKKGFEMTGLEGYMPGCVCPILSVDSVRVAFSDNAFDLEKPAHGVIQGGTVYFPDPYIPEQDNLRLVENFSFHFWLDREKVSISSLRANISKLNVSSVSQLTIPYEAIEYYKNREPVTTGDSPRLDLLDRLRMLRWVHEYFRDADDAILALACSFDEDQGFTTGFSMFSEGARLENNITTQSLYFYGKLNYKDVFTFGDGFRGELESVRYGSNLRIDGLSFFLRHEQSSSFTLPSEAIIQAGQVYYNGNSIDYVSADLVPNDVESGSLRLDFGIVGQAATAHVNYDLDRKHADIGIIGDFNPLDIADSGLLGDIPDITLIDIPGVPHVEGSLSIDDWKTVSDIRFSMVTDTIMIKGAEFDYARAKGSYGDHTVHLDDFAATQPEYVLRGKLSQNFETEDYRFLLRGEAIPTDLNPMFHSWWSRIWTRFEFGQYPAAADIDIWGSHIDRTRRFTFGEISFRDVAYKGLFIDEGKIRLSTLSKYTHLFDLDVHHAKGIARGDIKAIYQYNGNNLVSQRMDLFTDIPFHEVAKVVGEDFDIYVENTNADAQPDIWVQGCLVSDDFPEYSNIEHLGIKIHSETPVEFFGVTMDSVDAEILKTSKEVTISPVSFVFAKGQGTGDFLVEGNKPPRTLNFKIDITDFDYHIASKKIKYLNKPEPEAEMVADIGSEQKKDQPKKERKPSFMDLSLEGSCPLGDWSGLRGTGRFDLEDPLIHRVHVFGGFSKMMDNAELNLGSFSLKHAASSLRLEGKKIYFEDLELTGPSTRVKSKGVVNLNDQTLDFRLKTFPLGEVKFPVVAGIAFLLRPITYMFEMKATGPIDDPEWNLVLDPSGL